ncbi:glycosyltransferase family 25 protein [Rhizobium panacihumi]|uniref:glycosyltransferase family 25 protein n=1 Tax=Rhizobium panacihumi TaxID=2008450 RepID=UPI003D7B8E2B
MKIFVINLARNPERLERMERLLGAQGLEFERLDAVDGKRLDAEEIARWSQKKPDGSLCLSPSEVGCMLSHRHAWEKIAAMETGHAAVLEDDIHFSAEAAAFLKSGKWIPADAEIVKIETVKKWKTVVSKTSIPLDHGHSLAKLLGQHFGMAGYILSPLSARRLIGELGSVHMAVDQILFDPASVLFKRLQIYQMMPALCIQDQFMGSKAEALPSDITRAWEINRKRKTLKQKIIREGHRFWAQLTTFISGCRLNPFSRQINVRVDFRQHADTH